MLTDTTPVPTETEIQPLQRPPTAGGTITRPKPKRPLATPPGRSRTYGNGRPPDATAECLDTTRWETADDFRGVLFVVPGTPYRVAADPAGYCWLLQRRRAPGRWESV